MLKARGDDQGSSLEFDICHSLDTAPKLCHDAVGEVAKGSSAKSDWVPTLVDYLYVSVTNSSAFSPTDTMPLSSRTKVLMALQSISALVLSLLVISRAVSVLK